MSRFEGRPLAIPSQVEFSVSAAAISLKGPKGEQKLAVPPGVRLSQVESGRGIKVEKKGESTKPAFVGLMYRLLENALIGVKNGYEKKLEINGVGYRWSVGGGRVKLQVGFSHEVGYAIPQGVECALEKNVLKVTGVSKEQVGLVASQIRAIKPVEVYKGKGIKYVGEAVLRKVGKKGA